jgi:hypothetical protein
MGWYLMFGAVSTLRRAERTVLAERKPGCQSSFSRLSGRIQAHVLLSSLCSGLWDCVGFCDRKRFLRPCVGLNFFFFSYANV